MPKATRPTANLIRFHLSGDDAEAGRIPARDVAELIRGAERVLARAAGHARGRTVRAKGRWEGSIEDAVRLRFVGIESGSFVVVLAPPLLPPAPLGLDAETLTTAALRESASVATQETAHPHRDVAAAMVKWSDALGIGQRYASVEIRHSHPDIPQIAIDRATTERLRTVARLEPVLRENELIGRLVEADFERRTAHLRTATGDRVEVTFDAAWDDEVHQALRHETSIVGEVIYEVESQRAVAIHLRKLNRGEQLTAGLEPGAPQTLRIEEIAHQTGITPLSDPSGLYLAGLSPEEGDAFLAALSDAH